jgi:ribosome maturation factor RimP
VGNKVEVLPTKGDAKGKKIVGTLSSVNGRDFTVLTQEKQKEEGKKRPVLVEVEKTFSMDEIKYCKYVIDFK